MGFILEQTPTFSWPITVRETQDGGRYRTHTFDEITLEYQRIKSFAARDEVISELPTRAIASEILVGWTGIFEPDNTTQIPYSEDSKAQLLEISTVADVLVTTYIESTEKAKAKN
jgi:hypothetical protein